MRIGLLNAYNYEVQAEGYQADYAPMFADFLQRVAPQDELQVYDLPAGQWPTSWSECEGWLIGGSPRSVYDEDPWISRLKTWVQEAFVARAKIVGVCFGHQLIAAALGGRVERAAVGWGVGVQEFFLEQDVQGHRAGDPLRLLFSHRDQVMELPPGATSLARSDFCRYQMYRIDERVFCLQGHPEFSRDFMRARLAARREAIGAEVVDRALQSLTRETDEMVLGQWMVDFWQRWM